MTFLLKYAKYVLATVCALHAQDWTPPADVSATPPVFDAVANDIAVSPSGRFVVVWDGTDPMGAFLVQSSTSTDGINWSSPYDLSTPYSIPRRAFNPQVTADPSGLFVSVWERRDAMGFYIIQSSAANDGQTWSPPADLSLTGLSSYTPFIAASSAGRFVVVWAHDTVGGAIMQASTSTDGTSWSMMPVDISPVISNIQEIDITVDSSGRFVAVWSASDGMNQRIYASTTMDGVTWSAMPAIISPAMETSVNCRVAVNAAGRFVAIWEQDDVGVHKVKASTSLDGVNWSMPAADITPAPVFFVGTPQLAAGTSGEFVAIWEAILVMGGNRTIFTSKSSNGTAWSSNISISDPMVDTASPQIISIPAGGWMSLQISDNSPTSVVNSLFSPNGIAWNSFSTVSGMNVSRPIGAVSPAGLAVVAWDFNNGMGTQVQASASTFQFIDPPATASGRRTMNQFLTQTEVVNQLFWSSSPSSDIAGYKIYRDGALIATVSSNARSYNDPRGSNKARTVYQITAVNSAGEESDPLSVTIG